MRWQVGGRWVIPCHGCHVMETRVWRSHLEREKRCTLWGRRSTTLKGACAENKCARDCKIKLMYCSSQEI